MLSAIVGIRCPHVGPFFSRERMESQSSLPNSVNFILE